MTKVMFNKEELTAFVTRHPDSFPLRALLAHFEHFEGLGSRDLFEAAEQQQSRLVQQHLPRLTWEVNYWALMTCFQWYQADHDDSMLAVGFNELPRFDP